MLKNPREMNFIHARSENNPYEWINQLRQGFGTGYQNAQQSMQQTQQQKLMQSLMNPQAPPPVPNMRPEGQGTPQSMPNLSPQGQFQAQGGVQGQPGMQGQPRGQAAPPMMPQRDDMAFVLQALRTPGEDPRRSQVARVLAQQGQIAPPQVIEDKESGRMTSIYTLPDGQQIADTRSTGPGTIGAAYLKESAAASEGSHEVLQHLGQLERLIKEAPSVVADAVGPLNQYKPSALTDPNTRRMQGEINSISGLITTAAAKGIKGQFTGREQGLLEQIKPNISDNYEAFKGKITALKTALSVGEERSTLIRQLVRQGVPLEQAVTYAQQNIQMPESVYGITMAEERDQSMGERVNKQIQANSRAVKLGHNMDDVAFTARENNMTVEQVLDELEKISGGKK